VTTTKYGVWVAAATVAGCTAAVVGVVTAGEQLAINTMRNSIGITINFLFIDPLFLIY
jgi:hypothetical protein